jgi:osmotically-inducible protein OsmY
MECWKDIETEIQKHDLIKAQTLINRLEDMYATNEDDRIRLQVIEQLRKIGGVDASDKVDIKVQGDIVLSWGSEIDGN